MFNSKPKIILLAIAGCMIAIVAVSKLNQWIVQPAFDELEHAQALEDNSHAYAVIQGELRQLGEHLNDWAKWDDAYAYADHPEPAFIQANFSDWPMLEKGFRLNFCLILDRNGRILYRDGYDSDLGGAVNPVVFAGDQPAILTVFQPALQKEQPVDGLLQTEYGVLLLTARPILTTQGAGPASGVVIFGRLLDPPLLYTLIAQTQVKFAVLSESGSPLSAEEQALWSTLTPGVPVVWRDLTGRPWIYRSLVGLTEQPTALLRTAVRTEITAIGQRTGRILDGATGLMIMTLTGLTLYLLTLAAQRRQAETVAATCLTELHERDLLFRQLFERSGDANLLLDRDGFFDCNDAALALLGAATKAEILGCQPSLLSPERQPDGRLSMEKAREHIEAAFTDGHRRFDWVHRRLDGREVSSNSHFGDFACSELRRRGFEMGHECSVGEWGANGNDSTGFEAVEHKSD